MLVAIFSHNSLNTLYITRALMVLKDIEQKIKTKICILFHFSANPGLLTRAKLKMLIS